MKTKASIAIVAIIFLILGSAVILYAMYPRGSDTQIVRVVHPPVQTSIGTLSVDALLPPSPATVPLYHGYYGPNGKIDYSSPNRHTQNSIPEVSEIPRLAEQALAPYGGIPPDAVVDGIGKSTGKAMNLTTGEVVAIYLDSTNIGYSRQLNGMPVYGSSGQMIFMEFGENGELLWLYKKWLTLHQIDEVRIINASQAIDKALEGDILNPHSNTMNVRVTHLSLGYYTGHPSREEETLEPVWILSGPSSHSGGPVSENEGMSYYVDARVSGSSLQFANFTASPISGPAPLTVTFNDTSTGPVWIWHWDFGDGTGEWTQHPVHTYQNEGTYTVELLASDDDWQDTYKKTNYIIVGKKDIVT
ncbi:MAG: PKD domain-containing protein [Methanoregula sp.]